MFLVFSTDFKLKYFLHGMKLKFKKITYTKLSSSDLLDPRSGS